MTNSERLVPPASWSPKEPTGALLIGTAAGLYAAVHAPRKFLKERWAKTCFCALHAKAVRFGFGHLKLSQMAAPDTDANFYRTTLVAASLQQFGASENAVLWRCEAGTMVSLELVSIFLASVTALAWSLPDLGGEIRSASWSRRLAKGFS